MEKIIGKIKESQKIVVFVHENPDGDAIGSITALLHTLKKMGKNACGYVEFIPNTYSFLVKENLLKTFDEIDVDEAFELAISLDCGSLERLGLGGEIFKKADFRINIDHHVSNELFGDLNYVMPNAAATGEIIYDFIKNMGVTIDDKIAEALYTAIISDTGMFRHKNTTSKDFEIASELLKTGIDVSEISRKAFYETTESRTKCLAKVLSSLSLYLDGKVGIISISPDEVKEYDVTEQDLEGMVDYARNIKGTEVGIFIKPRGNEYKVSLRSNGKVNVSEIAAKFNGGGHVLASGCKFSEKSIEEIKEILLEELKTKV